MKKSKADPVDEAIRIEIAWCKKNRGRTKNTDYERGFIRGLQQAATLAKKARWIAETAGD